MTFLNEPRLPIGNCEDDSIIPQCFCDDGFCLCDSLCIYEWDCIINT